MLTRFNRWDPFEDLSALRNQMDHLFARLNPAEDIEPTSWAPLSDILETKDEVIIKTELPGIDEKDVNVELENGVLTIAGERQAEKKTEDKGYRRVERSYGKFFRSFTLPTNVDPDKINAKFEKGLLEVHVPKQENAKPRSIKIDVKKGLASAA